MRGFFHLGTHLKCAETVTFIPLACSIQGLNVITVRQNKIVFHTYIYALSKTYCPFD